jgi:hypothetical protein
VSVAIPASRRGILIGPARPTNSQPRRRHRGGRAVRVTGVAGNGVIVRDESAVPTAAGNPEA